jgi:hypothetical protein
MEDLLTAGCPKCDSDIPIIDGIHHNDGSACRVVARNSWLNEARVVPPLGRYDPRRDLLEFGWTPVQ